MKFDLIAIGNELLNGKIQDLNAHFVAQTLYKNNHQLGQVHIIGDNDEQFVTAMEVALKQSDIILICGGLGPTKDDITKNLLTKFFNKEIIFNEEALETTLAHYKRGNRTYDQAKTDYHNIPKDFTPVNNPVGYAPGLHYQEGKKHIFACPGVPSELQEMITKEILPIFSKKSESIIKHVTIKTWKLPESKIFNHISPKLWDQLEAFGEVSSLPHFFGVDIGVKLIESTTAKIESKEKQILDIINKSELRDYIWNIGPESLPEIIVKKAIQNKITIGFSESCTGGLCASRITDISGSSATFWGSIVSYANEVKMKSLNVTELTLKDHGAVSKQTALEMAIGAKEQLSVDIAVSTTGIAGPGGGSLEKPVGTVGIGVSSKLGSSSEIYNFHGNREILKQRFSDMALVILLEEILKFD